MAYKHGVYGETYFGGTAVASQNNRCVPVYVGTLPVHTVSGGKARVNTPILLTDFAQAVSLVGYSDDWEKYTLCEAIYTHLMLCGSGPICVINVFDPAQGATESTTTVTAKNNQIVLADMENAMLDSIAVSGQDAGSYTVTYDYEKKAVTIKGNASGVITGEVTVTYKKVDATAVTDADVIGTTDGDGTDTGLYLVRRVYQETGLIPNRLLAPGFTEIARVREAMLLLSAKVNGHFDAFIYTDIPLEDEDGAAIKPTAAAQWKKENGYDADNEKVHWPMWAGNDGRKYHLSVIDCALLQVLESATDGIPYRTSSNNAIPVGGRLYFGEDSKLSLDEGTVNKLLGANGIVSAIFHGGEWVLWGAHTASYDQSSANSVNVSETNLAMMQYLTNDFQVRRAGDIDKPMSRNRLDQIVAEEQAILDALGPNGVGALLYGEARKVTSGQTASDIASGDFIVEWEITQTPNTKSITGRARSTDEGYETYYGEGK